MTSLNVPPPQLSWKNAGAPQIEQLVDLRLPAIHYGDGVEALEGDLQKIGAYVFRLRAGGEEIWNEAEQRWAAVPADPATLTPVPFTYKAGDPLPWQGMLIAAGQKDKDGKDRFDKAAGGEPRYRLRTYARFRRDGTDYAGLSEPSPELLFASGADSKRFLIKLDPDPTDTQTCDKVTVVLKNASLVPAGQLEIRANGGQEIEIANFDPSGAPLAKVLLAADGSITLHPASGKKIVLEGDLEARRIRYQPSGGGAAVDL